MGNLLKNAHLGDREGDGRIALICCILNYERPKQKLKAPEFEMLHVMIKKVFIPLLPPVDTGPAYNIGFCLL
jgi:hypothetical protein